MLAGLEINALVMLLAAALMIGMAKTGIGGLGLIAVPLMALAFGSRESTGVLLPMLIMADIYAVAYYHKSANWRLIVQILPAAFIGIGIGIVVGNNISAEVFRVLLSIIVILMVLVMVIRDLTKTKGQIPRSKWFAWILGLAGGFATMIGNAAGPVFAVYLLAMRLPKNEFIGTGAWFFLIVNIFKLPFHVLVWETISWSTFKYDLVALPLIIVGAFLGVVLVKLFPETVYRWFVIVTTCLGATVLLF